MKHSIFLNSDDIVELKYVGDISEEENINMIKESYSLISQLIDKNKKPLVLVDMTKSKGFNPPPINVQAMRDSDAFRLAGIGVKDPADLKTAKDLISKSGSEDHVKIFDSREEAIAWLKS